MRKVSDAIVETQGDLNEVLQKAVAIIYDYIEKDYGLETCEQAIMVQVLHNDPLNDIVLALVKKLYEEARQEAKQERDS